MTQYSFRKAQKEDVTILVNLAGELSEYHGDTHRATAQNYLDSWDDFESFVVEVNKEVIGYITGFKFFSFEQCICGYDIQNMCVTESYRNQGAGKFLLNSLITLKEEEGIQKFKVSFQDWNKGVKRFYKEIGFQENTTSKNLVRMALMTKILKD